MRAACGQSSATVTSAPPGSADDAAGYTLLNPSDYQSFVGNWSPDDHPFCAAFASAADWDAVMHPAATMGSHTYAPPASFWADHTVLLLARVAPSGGDAAHVLQVEDVRRTRDGVEVAYTFTPPPAASSTAKYYVAISVAKPVPGAIRFGENGAVTCETQLGQSHVG
jgi:hypothetical protein